MPSQKTLSDPRTAAVQGRSGVREFLASQWRERGLTEASQKAYAYELAKLQAYLGALCLEDASEVQLREYLLAMHGRGVRAAAVRRATIVFRRYYGWLCREGLLTSNPAGRLEARRAPAKPGTLLGSQSLDRVLQQSELAPTRERLRDKALLSLVLGAGLRVGELLALKLSHLDLAQQELTLFERDGRRRCVKLPPDVVAAVRGYVEEGRPGYLRAGKPTDHVFLTRLGDRMSASGLWKHLQTLAERAGVPAEAMTVSALRQRRNIARAVE